MQNQCAGNPRPEYPILLKAAFESAAQDAANFLVKHYPKNPPIKARFPLGFIRSLASHYQRWPYLSQSRKRTVACVIQLCDVNRFHLNTWSLSLTAGTMWQWYCIMPVVAVIETLLHKVGVQEGGSPRTRSSRGRLIQRTPRAFTSKQCVTSFMNYEITETKFTYILRTIRLRCAMANRQNTIRQ